MPELSPIIFGAGAFNAQYDKDAELGNAARVLEYAFKMGITTIDTAAAYGRSEEILGKALAELKVDRSSYTLCTKCCRTEENKCIHSREMVHQHFNRSLDRLKTDYVDILYVHDVEFSEPDAVLEAISAAFELKDQGKARAIGISGLPLDVLAIAAALVKKRIGRPLDVVLSYCNCTLQCDLLLEYQTKLQAAGVKQIINASPLAMSLLRSKATHSFVPASPGLLKRADEIGSRLQSRGLEFADVATQFTFAAWPGCTVIGLRTPEEIDAAVNNRIEGTQNPTSKLWKEVQDWFGEFHNVLWEEEIPKKIKPKWLAYA